MSKSVSETCLFVKDSGGRCRVRPLSGSKYCFFHDPAKADLRLEASRNGGRRGKMATLISEAPDVAVESAQDVVRLLGETISQVRRGEIDPRIANSVGYLSGIVLKAREQGDIEDRLKLIEEEINSKGASSVTRIRSSA